MNNRMTALLLLLAMAITLLPMGALAVDEPTAPEAVEATSSPAPDPAPEPIEQEMPEPSDLPEPSPEPTAPGLAAFVPAADTPAPKFDDVPADMWFADAVTLLYRLGLVQGMDAHTFAPDRPLTAGECAALSVRVYARYHGLSPDLTVHPGDDWHASFLRLAAEYGILPAGTNGNKPLTRRESLYLMYRTLPESELTALRSCGWIPGLSAADPQHDEILRLYDAGILTGMDPFGALGGDEAITRAQYITLLARLIDPAQRVSAPLQRKTGMDAFETDFAAVPHPFTDIPRGCYYDQSVAMLYNLGLVNGISPTYYGPDHPVTRTQAVVLAVRVYERYHGLDKEPKVFDPEAYLSLAHSYGILPADWTDLDAGATRAEVVYLIAHTLPDEAFPAVRRTKSIPDVAESDPYYAEILQMYRAGIVGGSDSAGTFRGDSTVTRAEFAAMFARVADPGQRLRVDLAPVEAAIRNAVSGYYGDWSIYLMDVGSGCSVSINNKPMWSASIIKLYVMGAVMEALENGSLADSPAIQSNLRDMITWSSNDAWKYLATRLGGGNYLLGMRMVNEWCDRNGYPDSGRRTTYGNLNTSSVEDCGLFLQRVLAGSNVSAAASAQMLSLLKAQQRTFKIPAGVPAGVPTANKAGELNYTQNDAAIIFAPFGTYILVIMTEHASISHITRLSSVVYTAMEQAVG